MCYLQVYVIFDFADESTLKLPANMIGFLSRLVEAGDFRLAEEGISTAEEAWKTAVSQGQRSVYVALKNANHYSLSLSIVKKDWRRLYITANRGASEKADNVRALLSACEMLYETLAPDYGFGLVSMDTTPLDPPGEGDYGINTVYDFNFLSPRLVGKLGMADVKSVSCHRTVSFEDGGLLLEMSPNPLGERKPFTPLYQEAAVILRANRYQQGC